MEGPGMVQEQLLKELHRLVPLKTLKRLQAFYFDLFPEIKAWHRRVLGLDPSDLEYENAQKGYLRTPFGNLHRFYDVLAHVKGPKGWELRPSTDAKRAVAFVPQSCGRFILTRAAQRLAPDVQDTLRLFIHDEMLGLSPVGMIDRCPRHAQLMMEQPVPELNGLVFPVEGKSGRSWGDMS